ncbi:4'-phosphopantetheinyl transferase family protein [Acetilactobacillus jinshanensis]|uniref:4'-phosphopantetheinyl transferase family protein n=1 Tax=Acetilactobacillus jinshanensis TaxID=1720083 RepID=UPI0013A650B2|nr:4'-phosphopantetheinyl transferase superfamily protein [Acetilactobacillus jinshanensis]URL61753.1 4'-phosphopantetheinyl transferase superfamily protein [uncultured bacterium]
MAKLFHVPLSKIISGDMFIHGRFGKPYLKDHSLSFNITNSKEQVILAADKTPIAVDTEKIRPIDYHRIHRAFTGDEINYLAKVPKDQRSRATLKLWTIIEGVLKQVGTGLNGGVRTVHTLVPDLKTATRKGKQYRLIPYNVTPEYVGTIIKDL